ncbi:MAG: N-acylneuraminate-9-phosphate synthase [Lachnospiraceae bacterium]|jgi:sialic acid synthase SpsE|nr:N-acylneuraminate-9-phosphate synthase [Lachnospiraceae bacterium]
MLLKTGRNISNGGEPYIVAELNSSHNGKIEIAREMIDAAKECGCDAVKFQSWSAESLYCRDYYEQNPISKRMVSRFSLKPAVLLELSKYCDSIGIDFSSTPYSLEEVDFLIDQCCAPFVKVASMDINNLPYLKYIAKKNIPIILSTGMATLEEIEMAVDVIENSGNTDICILHCVSIYPVEAQFVNLHNMVMLKEKFPDYAVGYSDHTIGSEAACAAVALGAALIEKHFTLDNKKIGWDNQMATEPADMKALVDRCHKAHSSLGKYERELTLDELDQRKKMRRSIVAALDMSRGHVIEEDDITAKRPGEGIPVDQYKRIVGQVLIQDVHKDQMILNEYLCERGTE